MSDTPKYDIGDRVIVKSHRVTLFNDKMGVISKIRQTPTVVTDESGSTHTINMFHYFVTLKNAPKILSWTDAPQTWVAEENLEPYLSKDVNPLFKDLLNL